MEKSHDASKNWYDLSAERTKQELNWILDGQDISGKQKKVLITISQILEKHESVTLKALIDLVWQGKNISQKSMLSQFRVMKGRINEKISDLGLRMVVLPGGRESLETKKINFQKFKNEYDETKEKLDTSGRAYYKEQQPGYEKEDYQPASYSVPFMTTVFPNSVQKFFSDHLPVWKDLNDDVRKYLSHCSMRLEPYVQISPPQPHERHTLGFELLALGRNKESFEGVKNWCEKQNVQPEIYNSVLLYIALKMASTARQQWQESGYTSAGDLFFTINLDPVLLGSPIFINIIRAFRDIISAGKFLLEVRENLEEKHIEKLLSISADHNIHLSLDDTNDWVPSLLKKLKIRAFMTKVSKEKTWEILKNGRYGDRSSPKKEVKRLLKYHINEVPLVIEGIEEEAAINFFETHWDPDWGTLYGQGYGIVCSGPWDKLLVPAKESGLGGGYTIHNLPGEPQKMDMDSKETRRCLEKSLPFLVENDERALLYKEKEWVDQVLSTGENVLDFLELWLFDSDSPFCALLGDYGTGKTFSTRMFARRLFEKRQDNPEYPLPLYLDMRNIPTFKDGRVPGIREILKATIEKQGYPDMDVGIILDLVKNGDVVILFDGIDEKTAHYTYHQAHELWREIRNVLPPPPSEKTKLEEKGNKYSGKVLVSCRTHYFLNQKDEVNQISGGGKGEPLTRDGFRKENFRIAYLNPFDEDRIRKFLGKRIGEGKTDEAMAIFQSVHNLVDLAKRPFLLSLMVEHLAELEKLKDQGQKINAAQIYQLVVDSWLGRDVGKHVLEEQQKLQLMEEMAGFLHLKETDKFSVLELHKWVQENCSELFPRKLLELMEHQKITDMLQSVQSDVRTATFINRDNEGNFSFAHTSFREFFHARWIGNGLLEDRETTVLSGGKPLGIEVARFFTGLAVQGIFDPILLSKKLLDILSGEYLKEVSEKALYLAWAWQDSSPENAPYPVVVNLAGADLSHISMPGLKLKGGNFKGSDFFGSDLSGSVISETDMSCSDMRNINLSRSILEMVNLERADIKYAEMVNSNLKNINVTNTDFSGTELTGSVIDNADISGCILTSAGIARTSFTGIRGKPARADECRMFLTKLPDDLKKTLENMGVLEFPGIEHVDIKNVFASSVNDVVLESSVAAYTVENIIVIVDLISGHPFRILEGHKSLVTSVSLTPDGKLLASGSRDNNVRIWDVESGDCISILKGHERWVNSVSLSSDGKLLASGSYDNTVRIWDVEKGDCIRILEGHGNGVTSVSLTPDGKLLASGSYDNNVRIWDVEKGDCIHILEGYGNGITSVSLTPDGKLLASGSYDNNVRIWDVEKGDCIRILKGHGNSVTSVSLSSDGKLLASGSYDNTVRIWDVEKGDCISILKGHKSLVNSVSLTPDGKLLASGSYDKTVRVWDVEKGDCISILEGNESWINSVSLTPDGKLLASESGDRTVRIWDVGSGDCIRILEGHEGPVNSVSLSSDGKLLASGSYDKTVRVWDVESGDCIRILKGHEGWVRSVSLTPDGKLLASGARDKTVRVWDVESGDCIRILKGHKSLVNSVSLTPDGKLLASGSYDQTVRVWDVESGDCIRILEGHEGPVNSVSLTPDGKLLASGADDNTVRIWDVEKGDCIRILKGHEGWVRSVSLTPDGKLLASGARDKTVRVWDVESGDCIRILEGHESWINSVSLTPDGKLLASGADDDTIRIWDVEKEKITVELILGFYSWVFLVPVFKYGGYTEFLKSLYFMVPGKKASFSAREVLPSSF